MLTLHESKSRLLGEILPVIGPAAPRRVDGFDAYYKLKRGRMARVNLNYGIYENRYRRFTVTIINKDQGKIDEKTFKLGDFLPINAQTCENWSTCDRCVRGNGFHIWLSQGKAEWYIATPHDRALDPLRRAITDYIREFAD